MNRAFTSAFSLGLGDGGKPARARGALGNQLIFSKDTDAQHVTQQL
jgi:hypothetical protein